jgi:hypothetical protein
LRDDFQPDDTQLAIDAIGDYLLGRRTDEDPRTNGRDVTREQIGVSPLMGNKQIDPFVSAAWPVGPRCKHGASTVLQPTLQRIPCMTSRFNLSALFFAVIVGASGSAQASITDPANDFLPTYAGPKAGDLDVLTASCRRRLKTDPPCRLKSDPGMGPARWLPAVDNSTSLLVLS